MAVLKDKEGFRRGYTLIELIVVVALFSLLLSITLPNSSMIRSLNERHELRMVEKDVRQARTRAILENRTVMVTFYPEENRYSVKYGEGNNIKVHDLTSGVQIFDTEAKTFLFNGTGRAGYSNTVTMYRSDGRSYHLAIGVNTTEITLREVK
jgi:prepilin-type N-terminal cleavage/methylation domain-containing protein